jgi:hypothetical protein
VAGSCKYGDKVAGCGAAELGNYRLSRQSFMTFVEQESG